MVSFMSAYRGVMKLMTARLRRCQKQHQKWKPDINLIWIIIIKIKKADKEYRLSFMREAKQHPRSKHLEANFSSLETDVRKHSIEIINIHEHWH